MPAVGDMLGEGQIELGWSLLLSPIPVNRLRDKGPPVGQVCRVEWRLQGYRLMAAPSVRREGLDRQVQLPCFKASFNVHDYSRGRKNHKMEAGKANYRVSLMAKERKKSCHSHFSDPLSLLLSLYFAWRFPLLPLVRSSSSDVSSVKGLPWAEKSIVQPAHLLH